MAVHFLIDTELCAFKIVRNERLGGTNNLFKEQNA